MRERCESYEDMFMKLMKGDLPAMSGEQQMIAHIARKRGAEGHILQYGLPLYVLTSSAYVHNKNGRLCELIQRALVSMAEDGTLERIEQLYTGVSISDYTFVAEKMMYGSMLFLLLAIGILALTLVSGVGTRRAEEVEIRQGHPFEGYSGDAPFTRYNVRNLLTGFTRTMRLHNAVFRTTSGEEFTVPEKVNLPPEIDRNEILEIKSDMVEQHPKYRDWSGANLPRGTRFAFRSRLKTLKPELKMLAYIFGSLIEAALEASQYAANERALRDIVSVGLDLNDHLLCVVREDLIVEDSYGSIAPVSADKLVKRDLTDFIDQRSLKNLRKSIEQAAQSSRFGSSGNLTLLDGETQIPCSYRLSYRVLSRGDRLIVSLRDERTPTRIEESVRKAYRFDSLGSLAVAFTSSFESMFKTIQGYAGILLREGTQSGERHVSRISEAAERGKSLSEKLISIARGSWPAPQSMELSGYISETMPVLKTAFPDHDINVREPSGEQQIDTDPDLLLLSIFALLANAVEASPPQSEVFVDTNVTELKEQHKLHSGVLKPGLYAMIQVSDKGEGMNSSEASEAIKPFVTTKGDPHKGLGLTVCVHAVNAFSGGLEIDTAKGKGTKARIYIPARERSSLGEENLKGNGESLLLVNPSQEWLDILSSIFSRYNYQTSNVLLTSDAKRILQSQDFDGIVYEPERAGADTVLFIEEIRQLRPMIPVIVILSAGETYGFNKLLQDDRTKVVVRTGDVKHIVHHVRKIICS